MLQIGIWAGSSPSTREEIAKGLACLTSFPAQAVITEATKRHMTRKESPVRHYLAGPDDKKIQALLNLWNDDSIHEIFCVRGGYGTLRLLSLLDKIKLPKRDKRLWGFSDLTAIQNYLYGRLGLPWVHSPMITTKGFQSPLPIERKNWELLFGERKTSEQYSTQALKILNRPSKKLPRVLRGLPIIGGNLTCFVSMAGTPWQLKPRKDFLLFLEDISEAPYRIDRLLQQLTASGGLNRCRAVLLGHFTDSPKAEQVIRMWASEQGVLLLAGVKAGHEAPNLPLPMGVSVELTLKNSRLASLRVPIPFLK